MKKIALFFVAALLCLSVCPCLTACSDSSKNTDNPLSIGIPASELSAEELEFYAKYIADYSEYIKSVVCENIRKSGDRLTWNYTVIVDKFYIYDFSQVDAEMLTSDEKEIFDLIQNEVLNDCRMVVCCEGYWNYYTSNHFYQISNLIFEMFANDSNFVPYLLDAVFGIRYIHVLPEETRILDFGSKYAFRYQPSIEEAAAFEPNYKTVKPVETA